MAHYKFRKGQMSFEEVYKVVHRLEAIDSVKRAIYDYFLHGKNIKETGVNSSLLIPYLHKANTMFGNGLHDYIDRFLYTNEFNPSAC